MTTKIHIDFETRSTLDLKNTGVYVYAAHPTTDIWCMAWAIDDAPVELWVPGESLPRELLDVYYDAPLGGGLEFWAHNANFERIIWLEMLKKRYGFPPTGIADWHCSAAQCAAMGLPRKLDNAADALNLKETKDKRGHALMMQMSRPRSIDDDGNPIWWDDPDKRERLYEYCKQDIVVERQVAKVTRKLSTFERKTYLLDQEINDRGIRADVPLILAARGVALEGITRANEIIAFHTEGDVERVTQLLRMREWLASRGYELKSLDKASVADILQRGGLPADVEQVLLARSEAGKSSVAKLESMLNGINGDDRLRGLMVYHGAHTGRWAGRRVQPQNFPRPTVENPESYIPAVMNGRYDEIDLLDNPVDVVASLLRSMLIGDFLIGDYSAIEAIVIAWLAGQDDLVARFASGENVYQVEGDTVGATRQHGKAIILGCGFGMGAIKFVDTAKSMFGLDVPLELAYQFVAYYRTRYEKIPEFWYALQNAFTTVMGAPGKRSAPVLVGVLEIIRAGRNIWIVLPSGRALCYVRPRIDADGDLSIMRTGASGIMERRTIWGGVLAENVTQAVARDVMVAGLHRLNDNGYCPVLTVHDEIICEKQNWQHTLDRFIELMSETPDWAPGLPVRATGFAAPRYRKG